MSTPVDFTVQDEGSITILRGHTPEVNEWFDNHIGEHQTFGRGIVVERRYIQDIVNGLEADGFTGKLF
jgi:hypothetical protein